MLNAMSWRSWDELARGAPYFHLDEDGDGEDALFAIQLNERIAHAAAAVKADGAAWPGSFEDLAARLAAKIPELS